MTSTNTSKPLRATRKKKANAKLFELMDPSAKMMRVKTRCVLFLQNAWRHEIPPWMERLGYWPRESWLAALWACHTGRKLKMLWPGADTDTSLWVDNSTPKVGVGSSSVMPAEPLWVENVLSWHEPDFVIACGKQAASTVIPLWSGRLLVMPHPASRLNTNNLFLETAQVIKDRSFHRHRVTQEPGRVVFTPII